MIDFIENLKLIIIPHFIIIFIYQYFIEFGIKYLSIIVLEIRLKFTLFVPYFLLLNMILNYFVLIHYRYVQYFAGYFNFILSQINYYL